MNKRVAIIIVVLFCALIVGIVAYIYKLNMYASPQVYEEAAIAFNENNPNAVIAGLEGKAKTTDERILLAAAYLQLGSVSLQEEQGFNKAKPLLEEVLTENAQEPEALRLMGYGYEIIEDYNNAIAYYDRAIRADVSSAAAYSGKAHALALQGNTDEAIRQYDMALGIEADLDHALMGVSRLYIKKDVNLDKVEEYLQKVIDTSPNIRFVAEAQQILGARLLIEGKYTEALAMFDAAIITDPTLAQAYVGRVQAAFPLFKDGTDKSEADFEALMVDIEKATSLNPELTVAYYTAGTLLEYNGLNEIAQGLYIQALSVVDKDISLSLDEKASMRAIIESRMN